MANPHAPNTAEQYKIYYPYVAGLLNLMVPFVVSAYIDDQVKQETKKAKNDIRKQESSDGIRAKQELDFYASCVAKNKLLSATNRPNENAFLPVVQEEIRQKDISYFHSLSKREKERDEAVKALIKREGTEDEVAWILARTATFEEFNLSEDEIESIERNLAKKVNTICKEVYIYLRAWLVCSLKKGRYMPVEALKLTHPQDKNRYRSALERIYKDIIHRGQAKADFPTDSIKELIKEYLEWLTSHLEQT